MRLKLVSVIVVAVAAVSVAGQTSRPAQNARQATPAFDRKAFEIPHRTFVLDNGLTLIVHEDRSVPVVAVNLWYHVGSRNEQRGKTGFAHLFEHFFFNGSQHYPKGFREAMDDLGANNRNGTTDNDRTNFFEDVPVSGLERTLYLEADRLGFLAAQVNQAMLNRERGVVQNEKRQGENQPYGRVFDHMVERIYPASHPYNDQMALGVLHAAHRLGLRIPEDLSVVGVDDIAESSHFWPPLTTVRQPLADAGTIAVDVVVRAIRASKARRQVEDTHVDQVTVLQPTLIVRQSSRQGTSG